MTYYYDAGGYGHQTSGMEQHYAYSHMQTFHPQNNFFPPHHQHSLHHLRPQHHHFQPQPHPPFQYPDEGRTVDAKREIGEIANEDAKDDEEQKRTPLLVRKDYPPPYLLCIKCVPRNISLATLEEKFTVNQGASGLDKSSTGNSNSDLNSCPLVQAACPSADASKHFCEKTNVNEQCLEAQTEQVKEMSPEVLTDFKTRFPRVPIDEITLEDLLPGEWAEKYLRGIHLIRTKCDEDEDLEASKNEGPRPGNSKKSLSAHVVIEFYTRAGLVYALRRINRSCIKASDLNDTADDIFVVRRDQCGLGVGKIQEEYIERERERFNSLPMPGESGVKGTDQMALSTPEDFYRATHYFIIDDDKAQRRGPEGEILFPCDEQPEVLPWCSKRRHKKKKIAVDEEINQVEKNKARDSVGFGAAAHRFGPESEDLLRSYKNGDFNCYGRHYEKYSKLLFPEKGNEKCRKEQKKKFTDGEKDQKKVSFENEEDVQNEREEFDAEPAEPQEEQALSLFNQDDWYTHPMPPVACWQVSQIVTAHCVKFEKWSRRYKEQCALRGATARYQIQMMQQPMEVPAHAYNHFSHYGAMSYPQIVSVPFCANLHPMNSLQYYQLHHTIHPVHPSEPRGLLQGHAQPQTPTAPTVDLQSLSGQENVPIPETSGEDNTHVRSRSHTLSVPSNYPAHTRNFSFDTTKFNEKYTNPCDKMDTACNALDEQFIITSSPPPAVHCTFLRTELQELLEKSGYGQHELMFKCYFQQVDGAVVCSACQRPIGAHAFIPKPDHFRGMSFDLDMLPYAAPMPATVPPDLQEQQMSRTAHFRQNSIFARQAATGAVASVLSEDSSLDQSPALHCEDAERSVRTVRYSAESSPAVEALRGHQRGSSQGGYCTRPLPKPSHQRISSLLNEPLHCDTNESSHKREVSIESVSGGQSHRRSESGVLTRPLPKPSHRRGPSVVVQQICDE